MKIIVWIHTLYTQKWEFDYKPIWYLLEENFKNNYIAIKYSIDWWSKARIYKNWVFSNDFSEIWLIPKNPSFLRYIMEIIYMFFYLIFAKIKYKNIAYLWVDPLSWFSWAILRKFKIIDKFILITPDFTEKRFDNKLLNSAYFFCDKICTYFSNYNYCFSTETIRRKNEIYKNITHKLKHIPWYPPTTLIKEINFQEKEKKSIVFVWWIYWQINFESIFDEIFELYKKDKEITFYVIWDWSHLESIKQYISEKKYMDFIKIMWYLEYDEALKLIAKCQIWLAIYNGDLFFDKYRDSFKVRDYLALNVVPIMTDVVPSTANDLIEFNAWIVIKKDENNLENIILDLFKNIDSYKGWILKLNEKYKGNYNNLINDLKIWE